MLRPIQHSRIQGDEYDRPHLIPLWEEQEYEWIDERAKREESWVGRSEGRDKKRQRLEIDNNWPLHFWQRQQILHFFHYDEWSQLEQSAPFPMMNLFLLYSIQSNKLWLPPPFPSSSFILTIRFSVGSLKSIDGNLLVLPLGLSPNIWRWSTFSLLIGHFTFPSYLNFSDISRSSFSSSSITNSYSSIRHIHWSR